LTDAERADLQRRLAQTRSPADAFMMLVIAVGLVMVASAALELTARTSSTLVRLVLSGVAGLALLTAIGAFVGAVVVRPRSTAKHADRRHLEADLEVGHATVMHVTATRLVFARDLVDSGEGPWYLFDIGGDRALWLSGPSFAVQTGFPSGAFALTVTPMSNLVLGVTGSEAPLPLVEERPDLDVVLDYRDVTLEIIDGPFSDTVGRIFHAA
jgi:hypothetical protein